MASSLDLVLREENLAGFAISMPKSNRVSTFGHLVEVLERNAVILQLEAHHGVKISSELDNKLEWFAQMSGGLLGKLQSLYYLAEVQENATEVKEFASRVSTAWTRVNDRVLGNLSKIRVASRTVPGTPLSSVLEKIRKEANAAKISLRIGEVMYTKEYIQRGFSAYEKIIGLLRDLEKCDDKVQEYLAVCKMVPYIQKLESEVDKFVESSKLAPKTERVLPVLDVFVLVSKLLTGELLDQDPIDPRQVLSANVPKKPIFITKNNKRKSSAHRLVHPIKVSSSSVPSLFNASSGLVFAVTSIDGARNNALPTVERRTVQCGCGTYVTYI